MPKKNKVTAVVMSCFARSAIDKFSETVRDLELTLGPDTVGTWRTYTHTATEFLTKAIANIRRLVHLH